MKKKLTPYLHWLLGVSAFSILIAGCIGFYFAAKDSTKNMSKSYMDHKLQRENEAFNSLNFNLVDPEGAPESIRALAKHGFKVMISTQTYASEYVGGKLNCTNCHFAAGNTSGGSQGSISLVGVATKYPAYDGRFNKVITLPDRINNCFTRSMNGKAVPLDSELMLSLVTYFQWISKDLPIYGTIPWLGLQLLSSKHVPNTDNGKRLYEKYCALCHRDDGRGGDNNPPLWGDESFNDGAGLYQLPKMAAFIYWNMPYNQITPALSEAHALDVAAYILTKPRAHKEN